MSESSTAVIEHEPLTARMVNEFVYCPRLFHYEFVDGIFVSSADTLRGSAEHRRVDRGSGALAKAALPNAESEEKAIGEKPTIHSHSVQLGSDRLGVSAKLDLVETKAGEKAAVVVAPVEYKSGSPRQTNEGITIWDADRIQLGLQMWLLRENGYVCEEGVLYYRETKQRVPLRWTPELESWVEAQVDGARRCAMGARPLPLIDSPKCPRCSLAPVCLPDETNWLRQQIGAGESAPAELPKTDTPGELYKPAPSPPRAPSDSTIEPAVSKGKLRRGKNGGSAPGSGELRRLIAPRDDRRAVYLNTPGLNVGLRQGVLVAKEKEKVVQEIRVQDMNHLALFGNIQLSTQAIQILAGEEIPITYFSMGGYFHAVTHGHGLKNVVTRIEQFRAAGDPVTCLALAKRMVAGKVRNQRTLLMRNHEQPPEAVLKRLNQAQADVERVDSLGSLLGMEGAAAALYFEHFGGMLRPRSAADMPDKSADGEQWTFDFQGRNRRPPRDPVNAMLSLAYSLLAKDFTVAAYAVGFDPYVGFYHQPRFGRPALALDLMEEFRALVADSAVITAINNGSITARDFVRAGDAVNLSAAGRKAFFEVYEKRVTGTIRHPVFEYEVSYRRAFELQYRLLARALSGELAHYVPFKTR
ncbi:MAG: CRISPR-associated protein Cas1 [Chthoniobacteraceae bacterium]|nr:CRISPR-associated protein Cas1 [Chthoniobacteraceae bacterium]